MSYLERYANGDHEGVWLELGALHESELDAAALSDVEAVTLETIQRVKRNLASIAAELEAMGFVFGEFNDDGTGFYGDDPILRAHPMVALEDARRLMTELSSVVNGPVPLVYRVFAEQIGEVDFRGTHPRFKSEFLLDALMVDFFVPRRDEVEEWLEQLADVPELAKFQHSFAPDDFHKQNVSGGSPYSYQLPDDRIDPPVLGTPIDGSFTAYLRDSILTHACFPGFADIPADLLEHLRQGLVRF